MERRWISRMEAAQYLHTELERVDELVSKGILKRSLFDGKELFFVEHLDQFLLDLQEESIPSFMAQDRSPLEVRPDCRREQVERLIARIRSEDENPGQRAKTLARELSDALVESDFRSVPTEVAERLARWCSPRKVEAFVAPLAREISQLLFGRILERKDSSRQERFGGHNEIDVGDLHSDRLQVRQNCPREQVEELLARLRSERENPSLFGKMLERELRTSLDRSDFRSIPSRVVERLARWCSPRREDSRTRFVTPLAREIATLLFGGPPPRHD